jgi:hypothetical protein
MKYKQWLKNPVRFVAMTGYTPELFKALVPYFREAHDTYLSKYQLNGKRRSGGRKFVLYANSPLPSIEERLAFILSYLKLNPIQELHADLFGIEQKQCNEFIHGLRPILDEALKLAAAMPASNNKELQGKLQQLLDEQPGQPTVLHDAMERQMPRPQDEDQIKECYSGKRKTHTLKNALIVTLLGVVLFVSATVGGSMHDKKLAETFYSIPAGFTLYQDCGYQGYRPAGVCIRQPMKKPRNKEFTQEQKHSNQLISSTRVRIEHAIGSAKRYRMLKEECRLRKNAFPFTLPLTCTALHNFRIQRQPFNYKNNLT